MKRIVGVMSFLFIAMNIFAQDNIAYYMYYINKCISLLGVPVPHEFHRINEIDGYTGYSNDENTIIVTVENDIIIASTYGSSFDNANEASEFVDLNLNYFKNNNWEYYGIIGLDGSKIYKKNDIYVCIYTPSKLYLEQNIRKIGFSKKLFF